MPVVAAELSRSAGIVAGAIANLCHTVNLILATDFPCLASVSTLTAVVIGCAKAVKAAGRLTYCTLIVARAIIEGAGTGTVKAAMLTL